MAEETNEGDNQFTVFSYKQFEEYKKSRLKHLEILEKESEKGIVMTCGGVIEKAINDLLEEYLKKCHGVNSNIILGQIGFHVANRLEVCKQLKLVDDELHALIGSMLKIRNEFAHDWEVASFGDIPDRIKEKYKEADYMNTISKPPQYYAVFYPELDNRLDMDKRQELKAFAWSTEDVLFWLEQAKLKMLGNSKKNGI